MTNEEWQRIVRLSTEEVNEALNRSLQRNDAITMGVAHQSEQTVEVSKDETFYSKCRTDPSYQPLVPKTNRKVEFEPCLGCAAAQFEHLTTCSNYNVLQHDPVMAEMEIWNDYMLESLAGIYGWEFVPEEFLIVPSCKTCKITNDCPDDYRKPSIKVGDDLYCQKCFEDVDEETKRQAQIDATAEDLGKANRSAMADLQTKLSPA